MRLFEEQIAEWIFVRLDQLAEDSGVAGSHGHYRELAAGLVRAKQYLTGLHRSLPHMAHADEDDRLSHFAKTARLTRAAAEHSKRAAHLASSLGLHDEAGEHAGESKRLHGIADRIEQSMGGKQPKPLRGAIGKPSREIQAR